MRISLIVIFILLACLHAIPETCAALVNGEQIPLAEFNAIVESARINLSEQHNIDLTSEEGKFILATTQRSILDDMIDQIIIRQQAKKMNIQITSADITQEIDRLRKGFPSQKAFEDALVQENINSDDLSEGIRSRLVSEKIKKDLAAKTEISDEELEDFLRNNRDFFAASHSEDNGSTASDTDPRQEARKYLLRKKEDEIFERWFAKIKNTAKIEINPAILEDDLEPARKVPQQDNTITNGRV